MYVLLSALKKGHDLFSFHKDSYLYLNFVFVLLCYLT